MISARTSRPLTIIALALAAGAMSASASGAKLQGDAQNGAQIYARCGACHALTYDRTGPHHCGLFGRRAGSVEGFAYSDAMKHSKIIWTDKSLNRFIANPLKALPGTSMGYAGIADAQERADLIAYLKQQDRSAVCKPLHTDSGSPTQSRATK